jgi:MFS family permease
MTIGGMLLTAATSALSGFLLHRRYFSRKLSVKEADGEPAMHAERFHGWWVLGVTCLIVALSNGMTLGGITVFDASLLEALGAGRAELKFRDLVQMLTAAAAAPLLGLLADRVGVRPLMIAGLLLLAAGFAGYSRVDSLTGIYLLHVLLGLGLASTGLVLAVSVVSRWFTRRRGLALGLVLAGASLGNGLLPLLNAQLNASLGWRGAFLTLAALPLLLVPWVLWRVVERPAPGAGHTPGTAAGAAAATASADPAGAAAFSRALRDRDFLLLALIAFCTFLSLVGLTAHLFLMLRDQGLPDSRAAAGLTLLFAMGLAGKLLAGVGADRWGLRPTFLCCLGTMVLGALLLALGTGGAPWLGIGIVGIGWGGIYTMQQLAAAQLFSGPALGRIVGTLVLVDSTGAALGPWGIGALYDRQSSYDLALALLVVLLALAWIAALFLRLPARG